MFPVDGPKAIVFRAKLANTAKNCWKGKCRDSWCHRIGLARKLSDRCGCDLCLQSCAEIERIQLAGEQGDVADPMHQRCRLRQRERSIHKKTIPTTAPTGPSPSRV